MKRIDLMMAALVLGVASPVAAQTVQNGIEAWQHSDYDKAVKIWRPLAEQGDPDAQFNLAQAYRLGRGVSTNLAAAQIWLERAAVQGHVDAQTTLGLLLFQSGDKANAMKWLKASADKNDPRALLVYGTALFNGDSVTQDAAQGYADVSRAAAQGLAPAKSTLAEMGQVISTADRKKAATLVAQQNNAPKTEGAKPGAKALAVKAETKTGPKKRAATEKPVVATSLAQKSSDDKIAAETAPAKEPAHKVAAKAPGKTAAAKPAPAPKPTSALATARSSGSWRIQLGAFSQRSSAEALFRKLAGSAPVSGRSAAYSANGSVTRLQVGPFASKAAADEACRVLSGRGQPCFPVPGR